MNEAQERSKVIGILKNLHPIAVENVTRAGTPDINYVYGWLELKYLREWPKKARTIVQIPHYTREQRTWAIRRAVCGGRVHLLLRAEDDWLLLPQPWAAMYVGKVGKAALIEAAECYWLGRLGAQELLEWLSKPLDHRSSGSWKSLLGNELESCVCVGKTTRK